MRIALIEDEPAIRQELTLLLQNALYEVTALDDFANAASAALAASPDLIYWISSCRAHLALIYVLRFVLCPMCRFSF